MIVTEKAMYAVHSETESMGNIPGPIGRQLWIILIGGHTRNVRHLIERGRTAGWNIESHSGEVRGRGTKELRARIGRADILVITTRVNSHGGMFLAKDYARRLGRFITIIRRGKFAELEEAIVPFQTYSRRNEGN